MRGLRSAWKARLDPIVLDRRIDVAAILTWACYAAWGLLSAFSDVTVFSNINTAYPAVWGALVGLACLVASSAATITFFIEPDHHGTRVRAKRVEVVALCSMLGLLLVYPLTLLLLGTARGEPRYDLLALALSYFPFAVVRVIHLHQRIRRLYTYTSGKDDA